VHTSSLQDNPAKRCTFCLWSESERTGNLTLIGFLARKAVSLIEVRLYFEFLSHTFISDVASEPADIKCVFGNMCRYITSANSHSDLLAVVYVLLFWMQSGVVNSVSFVLADRWASAAARGRADGVGGRAGGVLALVFQASCLVGLGFAYLLQHSVTMFESDWT
jgi:hypothetical protein